MARVIEFNVKGKLCVDILRRKKMKAIAIALVLVITVTNAQNYQISFGGAGARTTVDSVQVDNLTKCTHAGLGGADQLSLSGTVGIIKPSSASNIDNMHIVINAAMGLLDIYTAGQENLRVGIYDMCGREILKTVVLPAQRHLTCKLKETGSGIYFLRIEGADFTSIVKMIRYDAATYVTSLSMDKQRANSSLAKVTHLSTNTSVIPMLYSSGDILKLTGKSGSFRTISMLTPTKDQTITFNFAECTDADSNHYAIVQIGTQIWMEENLKATKYRDGSAIPNVSDSALWYSANTGVYCDYHNLASEGTGYGHLYNWYAIADKRNMCPLGWHVPSDSEWIILTTYCGGAAVSGKKLKENCTTRWAYLDSTWGTNETGFTGLCANYRMTTGAWSMAPDNNHDSWFWTSTELTANSAWAWARSLRWCYNDVWIGPPMKSGGFSVRCVKD
jgi:uncharacterized protein (TIGR02145 family)